MHVLESCATFYRLCLGNITRGRDLRSSKRSKVHPPTFDKLPHYAKISLQEKACLQLYADQDFYSTFHPDPRAHCRHLTTLSRAPTRTASYPRSLFDMSEITHPTIKGPLSCGTVGSPLDLANTIDRWLVPRNIPHVARSSYDPQSQPGPPPREIEVPGRPYLRIQRPWRCPRAGQRHPMLRTR